MGDQFSCLPPSMRVISILSIALGASTSVTAISTNSGTLFDLLPGFVQQALKIGQRVVYGNVDEDASGVEGPWNLSPHRSHGPFVVNKTIYQVLGEKEVFSKLFKLVNLNNATVDILNSSSSNITFFALPNSAFPKPPKHRHFTDGSCTDPRETLGSLGDEYEYLLAAGHYSEDDKEEKRRKIIQRIVGAILSYHVLPTAHDVAGLASNTTHSTNLTLQDGSLDGKALRLRIGPTLRRGGLSVNLFSKVTGPEVFTSNGVIHFLDTPLLPPPAIFTGQFNVPSIFSIATSALQRVGLDSEVDYIYRPAHDKEEGRYIGASTVTFFAPSNRAFFRLPPRLRLFLFSPFGHRALKKLLQYHIVPSHILHSDFLHNATQSVASSASGTDFIEVHGLNLFAEMPELASSSACSSSHLGPAEGTHRPPHRLPPRPKVEFNVTFPVPTLLEDRSHTVVVTRFAHAHPFPGPAPAAARTHLFVSGTRVALPDVPARNGAVHVIDRLLNPFRGSQHHDLDDASFGLCEDQEDEWVDWETWLPAWAESD